MSTSAPNVETEATQQSQTGLSILPSNLCPNIDHIKTEDDAPMDNVFSEKQQRLLTEPLYTSWQAWKPFVAMANVGLFFALKQPPLVPDVLLSLEVQIPADIHPKANRSYFVWEYGKPPTVAIEIVSNKEGGEDQHKRIGYARIGIAYYAIYDPDQHLSDERLRIFRLNGITYERLSQNPSQAYPLPSINLGLAIWRGEFEGCMDDWLRWIDSSGLVIPTGAEVAETERQRADAESMRADAESMRAEDERSRANKLAEQLRKLGFEPDL